MSTDISFLDVLKCFPSYPNLKINDVVLVQHWGKLKPLVDTNQAFKDVLLFFAGHGALIQDSENTNMFHLTELGLKEFLES